jgi:FkbM family methyltransferase
MRVRAHGHELRLRPLDSDLFVAAQIFGWQEYDLGREVTTALNRLAHIWRAEGFTPLIVDAGANVGYSSLYFARAFPEAMVVAVEPDRDSFSLLTTNCAAELRIRPVHAALWSHERGVAMTGGGQGSWSLRVESGGATPSVTLDGLMALAPKPRPLIVKLDIEGAEREVCEAAGGILRQAPCIMIEPHDFMIPGSACLSGLYRAVAGRTLDTVLRGENLMLFDSALAAGRPAEPAPRTAGRRRGGAAPASALAPVAAR